MDRSFLNLMETGGMALVAAITGSVLFWVGSQSECSLLISPPDAALNRLMDGNQRFVQRTASRPIKGTHERSCPGTTPRGSTELC